MKTQTNEHIVARLQEIAKQRPDAVLFRYIEDEKGEPIVLTYAEVDREARKIASHLLTQCKRGDRALMLYPAGLEFVTAFYGCLYAGLVAVPAYPPRKNQKITRLKSIIEDADAAIVMTSEKAAQVAKPLFDADETLSGLFWLESDSASLAATDDALVDASAAAVKSDDIAFLQYTSGSTGNPKGVVVSHANLMSNMEVIYTSCGYTKDTIGVSWLPHFHDMGLMAGVVQPIYSGTEVTFMAPAYFLQKPIRWIQMIDKYKATAIAGPNFAYELCVEKIADADLAGLDMSTLTLALNGAEPVHAETMRKFSKKFAVCGFNPKAHFPSYGMAETTLMLTAGNAKEEAKVLCIDSQDIQEGVITPKNSTESNTQEMVSSGHAWTDHEVIIVDQESLTKVEEDRVGEVWARGSSIAQGYWKNPEKTEEDFHAYLSDTKEGPYLRTGDLGFLHEGELYIAGRAKDLLIIRGRNYYPQDIELAVGNAHEAVALGNAAAFSLDIDDKEQLVIVQEIQRTHMRKFDEEAVLDAMIETIAADCELQVYDIVLVRPGQVLKTSSGKIQRQANKKAYLDEGFKVLGRLRSQKSEEEKSVAENVNLSSDPTILWLQEEIAKITQTPLAKMSEQKNFMAFGLDSLASIELQNSISEHFLIDIPLVSFYDYPSIAELAPHIRTLVEQSDGKQRSKKTLVPLEHSEENCYEKFALNNIQQAYLLGRSPDLTLGNTPCFAYAEIAADHLDMQRLEAAWNRLLARHEMLRCVMHEDITQQIIETVPYQKLLPTDISQMEEEKVERYLKAEREKKLTSVPDPTVLPLVSLDAYLLPNNRKKLHIYVDMLVCDASSMFIILEDLYQFYTFPEKELEPLGITFKDYLHYAEEHKEGEHFDASLKYWRSRLETLPSGPTLALDKQPVQVKKPKFNRRSFTLNQGEWKRFKTIAAEMNVTPTAVLLALYGKVLATWSNDPHFCINLTHFHRLQAHKNVNKIVGDFTSLIPLEVNIPPKKPFETYLKEVQSQLLNDLEHDAIGGIQILREMRSIGRESAMPVVFTSTLGLNDFACDWMGQREFTISQTPQVWIDNQVMQKDGELIINWDCIDELFRLRSLENMFQTYTDLIEAVLKDPKQVFIDRYSSIFERRDNVYANYNRTEQALPTEVLPLQCMQAALAHADKEAIITSGRRISYRELHNASAQIATVIEERRVEENEHIAIILPKGWVQVVSVLACGYAGAAYLPMAIDYPKNRMQYLIDEAKITTVLSDAATLKMLALPSHIRGIDVEASVSFEQEMPAYDVKAKADALAYTIFTSGSTGKPKGVMITHESVCNTVVDINKRFNVTEEDVFFGISALNFDLSVYDIYGALSAGASLIIPDEEKRKDSADWFDWIVKENVTVWNSVPALMKLVCQEAGYAKRNLPESLRLVLLSGDFIPLPLYKDIVALAAESCEIISLGGATEASIWSIYFPIKTLDPEEEKIPYGYPLANQQLYVLDDALDARPYLVHGDIYIKGLGVAQGYFNDPERSKAQFIVDPDNGEVLYKTGDIGYLNPKGYIDIVGRSDEQVKIQGYRVELGEIEQHMLELDDVKEAVVLAKQDETKHNILVAYITTDNNKTLDMEVLKYELALHVPEYMVPLSINQLESMPLTANGKVDKKGLLALDVNIAVTSDYVAPRTEIEAQLAKIFAEVLQVEKVGIYDNFFELGGHSLLATQLVSKIRAEMQKEITLKMLFHCSTIAALQRAFTDEHLEMMKSIGIMRSKDADRSVLSFAQERLWFIDQLEPGSANYNLPIAVEIRGALELAQVEQVLNTIVSRHESLRTVFVSQEGAAKQKILEDLDFKVTLYDLSDLENAKEKARVLAQEEALRAFDLEKGPLFRAMMIKVAENVHILVLNMHHIISDGWSIGILFHEFDALINGLVEGIEVQLPALPIDYVDYSIWQRKRLEEGALEKDLAYWEEELTPYPAEHNVSRLLNKEPVEESEAVTTLSKSIAPDLLEKLEKIGTEHHWTLNQILLAAYSALIYRYTNQGSMVIAVPNANRPTSETEGIIGFFVNTMLIKIDIEYASSYADVTSQVQEKLLGAIDHQDAPLQSIIENLRANNNKVELDDSFQFAFNPLPMGAMPNDETKPFAYDVFDIGIESAKTLLTLTLNLTEGTSDIQFTYKSARLADEKIETFMAHYHAMLNDFSENTESLVMLAPVFDKEIVQSSGYDARKVKGVYPFTQVQTDMYLQGLVHFQNKFIIGWYYAVEEAVDISLFKRAILDVFSQIDTINLRHVQYEGQNYQMVLNSSIDDCIVEVDLQEDEALEALIYRAASEAIDIEKGSPVRAVFVFKEGVLSTVAYMGHHAIMDGMSLVSLKTLVDKSYKACLAEAQCPEIAVNTTVQDIERLIKIYDASQVEHWKEPLSKVGNLTVFNASDIGAQKVEEILLDKEMLQALNRLKKEHKVSIIALMNALYLSVLYRLFNFTDDLVFFEPLSVRKSLKDVSLGMYVDIRPLIVKAEWFDETLSIVALAKHIHETQQNSTVPISMQDQAKLIPGGDVVLGLNFIPQLKEKSILPLDKIPENEVQFTIFGGKIYSLRFTYPENVFNGVHIAEKFLQASKSLLRDDSVSVLEMDFLDPVEKKKLLTQFDVAKTIYENRSTIPEMFERQAALRTTHTALVYEGKTLSYQELNERANQLAHYLVEQGVKADELVGICVNRSLEMIIGLLAILKSGAAYLPVDPSSPKDRIEYILEDSRTKLVLTQAALAETVTASHAEVVFMDRLDLQQYGRENPSVDLDAHNLAYVIYTSGSTGKPKGVMLEHANVERLFKASEAVFHFDENDSWTLFHSFAFDFSVWEIWGALLHGGKLHVLSYDLTRSGEDFYRYLLDEKVTILNQTPAAFHQLIHIDAASGKKLDALRTVIFGGEKLDFTILAPWFDKYGDEHPELVNMYGITETTVHVTYYTIRQEDIAKGRSIIGKAYNDLSVYILDAHNNMVPIGLPGELHVAGNGLARGYLYQEALSDEKFIDNPFSESAKLYKTGDLVRFMENGDIEYLGRIDDQVKVRGFRIELGEIEHQLLNIPEVEDAVVLVKEDENAGKFLVAYLSAKENITLDMAMIKAELSQHIPDYMIPSALMQIEEMPLTSNGKIDKKALDALEVHMSSALEYVAPRDETEKALAALFQEVLKVPKVGIYDNFFELGGHSLLATQLVSKIRAEMHVELSLKMLFDKTDVYALAKYMREIEKKTPQEAIPILEERDNMPLSFTQERLWFLEQFASQKNSTYHIPGLLRLEGTLNKEALRNALQAIVERHEVLRTTFAVHNDVAVQRVQSGTHFRMKETHCRKESLHEKVAEALDTPFDLEKDLLFRAELFEIEEKEHYLFVNMHHIISDGWSIAVLVEEFVALYHAYVNGEESPLPALPLQFADYAAWQKSYLSGEVLEEKLAYWKEALSSVEPLALPTSYSRPSVPSSRGKILAFEIPKPLSDSLAALSKAEDVTLFMTLLSAFSVLMQKYSGQEEIAIGSPIANRERAELESLIGFFVNTLVLKQSYADHMDFTDLLKQTKERTLNAYAHQDVPFEKIVDVLDLPIDTSRTPLFQVMFVLQNAPDVNISLDGLEINIETLRSETAKFDITMELTETEKGLSGSIEYATDLFSAEYIEKLMAHFTILLENIVAQPSAEIAALSLLSEEEKKELLFDMQKEEVPYDKSATIHAFFETQAEKTPDNVALVYEDKEMCYAELNSAANRMAHYLMAEGIGAGSLVAISLERSFDMVIALLAVLKAGAAYVPVDPLYPEERKAYIFADSKASFVFTEESLAQIDSSSYPDTNPELSIRSKDLAYVIYTSGSTGNPKGVMLAHQGVVNLNTWYSTAFDFNEQSANLIIISFGFDAVQKNIFSVLMTGGRVVLPRSEHYDAAYLTSLIERHQCTHLNCVPSAFYPMLDISSDYKEIRSLQYVLVGGEASKKEILDPWLSQVDTQLVNVYGPTECNDISLFYRVSNEDVALQSIPVGSAVNNAQIYILDAHMQPVPKGVAGELHLAGDILSRGYLYQEAMTEEKFVDNPFKEGKLYKTGDLVKYLPDGNVEYLGRVDDQVKIRGYRIELGEIEQQLLLVEEVKDTVVLAKENENGQKILVAYLTATSEEVESSVLKERLSQTLPDFMVPSSFMFLDAIPFTPNGKVDKKALLKLDVILNSATEYVAARTEEEEKLVEVFSEVLQVEKVGIYDNFFELGGNSILSVQVTSKAKERGLDIKLPDLFQGQTVAKTIELSLSEQRFEIVDLEKEAILNEEIQPLEKSKKGKDKEVFLTGATGFVGKYFLHELLSSSDVTVHCLVRGATKEAAMKKLQEGLQAYGLWEDAFLSRIRVVLGDLVAERFGIDEAVYADLCNNVDRIYHSAVYMNNMATYDFLAEVNVGAIEKILSFASTEKQKPIEYISTVNIFHTLEIVNEDTPIEGQKHLKSNGYAATKFLAEKLILIAQERGFDINIYRLGLVVGDKKIGKNDNSQWFYKLLNAAIELHATPDFKGWVIPMTPVDFVAKSVVALANSEERNRVYHLSPPFNIRFMDLVAMYNAVSEEKIETIEQADFIARVEAHNANGQRLPITDYITENMKRGFENFVKVEQNAYLHSFKTMHTLKTLGITFPDIDSALAQHYFECARHV